MFSPKNIPQLSLYFTVKDGAKSIEFYSNAFGFTTEEINKSDQGEIGHVSMRKQDAIIMFAPEGHWGSPKKAPVTMGITLPISAYIYCENVDTLYKQAIKHGAKTAVEPNDSFWGDRFCSLLDPDGYEWLFATALQK
jgi:uncharacterized glyoxalase superfamily protein PhnB